MDEAHNAEKSCPIISHNISTFPSNEVRVMLENCPIPFAFASPSLCKNGAADFKDDVIPEATRTACLCKRRLRFWDFDKQESADKHTLDRPTME